jgi:hypothetical protein
MVFGFEPFLSPWGDVRPLSPLPHILPDPQEGAPPNRAPAKRDALFLDPSKYLLKFPVNRLPSFPQQDPTETGTHLQNFYTISSKSPVNEPPPPPPCSPTGSRWREKLPFQSQWFNHPFISIGVPNKEPSHEKKGENIWSLSTEPHVGRRPTYSGVWPGSPRGPRLF